MRRPRLKSMKRKKSSWVLPKCQDHVRDRKKTTTIMNESFNEETCFLKGAHALSQTPLRWMKKELAMCERFNNETLDLAKLHNSINFFALGKKEQTFYSYIGYEDAGGDGSHEEIKWKPRSLSLSLSISRILPPISFSIPAPASGLIFLSPLPFKSVAISPSSSSSLRSPSSLELNRSLIPL